MKEIYFTIGLLMALSGHAQNKHTEKADRLLASYQYVSAIKEYEGLVENKKADAYVYRQLADGYYHIFNIEKAVYYYAKAVESKQDAEVYFNYAQALKLQGKYAEADTQMDKFAVLKPSDQRAKDHKANPNYVTSLQANMKLFDINEAGGLNNEESSDFGAILDNEGNVYFASNRKGRKDKRGTGEPYLDIYKSVYGTDGSLTVPVAVNELNTRFHDGPAAINAAGTVMYFSRDGHADNSFEKDKKANIKIGKVGLYRAEKEEGKWTNIKPVSFNSTEYSVGNPSLSKDGKTLYFASDMPGGVGNTDIWKVTLHDDGSYGKPVNLGSSVNTEGKESFPFIDEDNVLYFASSGRQGFGGLDIFKVDLKTNSAAQNIGKPVNSEKDDFGLTLNRKQEIGFFSSNRNGNDNIYFAYPICKKDVNIVVKDAKTGRVLEGATVSLLDERKNVISAATTTVKGTSNFITECNKGYTLQASLKDYEGATVFIEKSKEGPVQKEILLSPIEVVITEREVVLNPIHFEFNKSNITMEGARELDKLVKVLQERPAMVIFIKSHTDTQGSADYNMKLSQQRSQSTVQYVISKGIAPERISGKGFGFSEPRIDCKDECTEEQHAQNRRSEFLIVKQ